MEDFYTIIHIMAGLGKKKKVFNINNDNNLKIRKKKHTEKKENIKELREYIKEHYNINQTRCVYHSIILLFYLFQA